MNTTYDLLHYVHLLHYEMLQHHRCSANLIPGLELLYKTLKKKNNF